MARICSQDCCINCWSHLLENFANKSHKSNVSLLNKQRELNGIELGCIKNLGWVWKSSMSHKTNYSQYI